MSRRHGIFERSALLRGDADAQPMPLADRARAALARPGWVPALPASVTTLLRVCEGPRPPASDVLAVFESDAALAAEVLRRLRAAAPHPARAPRSLAAALRAPGLGCVLVTALAVGVEPAVFDGQPHLVAHAHLVADLAARLAPAVGLPVPRARAAGLLHDVGRVGIVRATEGLPGLTLTRAVVDDCHADAGVAMLTAWRLPAPLVHAVGGRADRNPSRLARLVSLADALALDAGSGHGKPGRASRRGPAIGGIAWDLPVELVAEARALGLARDALLDARAAARA